MRKRAIIAIDGPAGSGKSSTARAVAGALGYAHVDSGAVYRAVTLAALDALGEGTTWGGEAAVGAARMRGLAVLADEGEFRVTLGGADVEPTIRTERVTRHVSRVSALPAVRTYVNELLRSAAAEGGVVMDGRDIGTVVFPDAEVKVFLVADSAERARRRLAERGLEADAASLAEETGALTARDVHDSRRDVAPLREPRDAVRLDTTRLSFAEQVQAVIDLALAARRNAP